MHHPPEWAGRHGNFNPTHFHPGIGTFSGLNHFIESFRAYANSYLSVPLHPGDPILSWGLSGPASINHVICMEPPYPGSGYQLLRRWSTAGEGFWLRALLGGLYKASCRAIK